MIVFSHKTQNRMRFTQILILTFLFAFQADSCFAQKKKKVVSSCPDSFWWKFFPAEQGQDSVSSWCYVASFPAKKIAKHISPKDFVSIGKSFCAFERWLNKKMISINCFKKEIDSLSFTLDVRGKAKDIQIFPNNYSQRKILEALLKEMPKWKPAEIVDGQRAEIKIVLYESSHAEFPGGEAKCLEFLAKTLHYPDICKEQGIQGRAVVAFVIDVDGSIVDAEVKESSDPNFSKEALRVVRSMPKWEPATLANKPVKSRFNLPLLFSFN